MDQELKPASAGSAEPCLPPALRKPRLRRTEASEYLKLAHGIQIAPSTLAKLVTVGGGPTYHRWNRTPLYGRADLDVWATEKLGRPIRNSSECAKENHDE